jgi:hypothetical protein
MIANEMQASYLGQKLGARAGRSVGNEVRGWESANDCCVIECAVLNVVMRQIDFHPFIFPQQFDKSSADTADAGDVNPIERELIVHDCY